MRFSVKVLGPLLTIVGALALAQPALAAERKDTRFLVFAGAAAAPQGFVDMCRTDDTWCHGVQGSPAPAGGALLQTGALAAGRGAAVIPASWSGDAAARSAAAPRDAESQPAALPDGGDVRAERQLLQKVTRHVNNRVRQLTDTQIFGAAEVWTRSGTGAGSVGDCEDIAIEKRFALVAGGFAPERLSFAVVYSPAAGLHTVLVARTADGDMVLDNRNGFVMRWDKTEYVWLSVQSADPMQWRAVARA